MTNLTLTPTQARRLAIIRQKLAGPQPAANPNGIMEVMRNLGYIQIDPIRAVERTQYLVLWSRLGNYNPAHLNTLLWEERKLFEYWAHAAAIVLTKNYPIHHLQMRRFAQGATRGEQRVRDWLEANAAFRQHIKERLRAEAPLATNQFEDLSTTPWVSDGWNSNRNVSLTLQFMWEQGEIMVAERNGLERKWALIEQHLPEWTNHSPLPTPDAVRQAVQISLRALGVATAKQIANHFIKGHYHNLKRALADLVSARQIVPVTIANGQTRWPGEWYIHADDAPLLPQLSDGNWQPRTSLLSPFDNLIIDRDRAELMWDFYFRIEIYVPKAKREYGYYVLPILHGDRLIGRIDPKMDRKSETLHINAIYAEPDAPQDKVAGQAVAQAITGLAQFLGAKNINYGDTVPPGWQAAFD